MPMKTTPRTGWSASRAMMRSCARISQVFRLRMPPSRPVAQKSHASAQPTCELRQTVYLAVGSASSDAACPARRRSFSARAAAGSGSGMRTASISRPSGHLKRYFKNPSSARRRSRTSSSGQAHAACRVAAAAWDRPRTDPGGNSAAPSRWTRAKMRDPTSAPTPRRPTAATRSSRSKLRRFSGSEASPDCTAADTVPHCHACLVRTPCASTGRAGSTSKRSTPPIRKGWRKTRG